MFPRSLTLMRSDISIPRGTKNKPFKSHSLGTSTKMPKMSLAVMAKTVRKPVPAFKSLTSP